MKTREIEIKMSKSKFTTFYFSPCGFKKVSLLAWGRHYILVALTNKRMNVSGGACLNVENIIPAQGLNHGPGRIDDSIEIKELNKSIKINLIMLLCY